MKNRIIFQSFFFFTKLKSVYQYHLLENFHFSFHLILFDRARKCNVIFELYTTRFAKIIESSNNETVGKTRQEDLFNFTGGERRWWRWRHALLWLSVIITILVTGYLTATFLPSSAIIAQSASIMDVGKKVFRTSEWIDTSSRVFNKFHRLNAHEMNKLEALSKK